MRLTKSLFVDFCSYPKLAWWKANNLAVYKKICKIETEEQEDHMAQIGQAVEDVVKQLLEVNYHTTAVDLMPHFHKSLDDEGDDDDAVYEHAEFDFTQAQSATLEAIKAQTPLLYQPTFQFGDCHVRADFMVRNGTAYDLIEVKAKSGIRKDKMDDGVAKPIGEIEKNFIQDVSFQAYVINNVLQQNNLGQLGNISFAYLNKEYIKDGDLQIGFLIQFDRANEVNEIEIVQRGKPAKQLIDDRLLPDAEIELTINKMREYLVLSEEEANKVYLRGGTKYLEYFGEEKPFGTIMGMGINAGRGEYVQELYYQKKTLLEDLNDDEIDGFSDKNKNFICNYLDCKKSGEAMCDRSKIAEIFNSFRYPICFYDYETISIPVPLLNQTRPYMQTVVQYSLHKYAEDGTMQHYGGLYAGEGERCCTPMVLTTHPNMVGEEQEKVVVGSYKDLLDQMLVDIGDDLHQSTFIVWHESFENSRNKEIAKLFPDIAERFLKINERTYDLKRIVSDGYYFNPACKGSASIKKVLPVLVPEMTYESMIIGRGDIAMRALYMLISNTTPPDERDSIIQNLLLYCGQDTLAMVRIFEALKKLC